MKKHLAILCICASALATLMTGCGDKDNPSSTSTETARYLGTWSGFHYKDNGVNAIGNDTFNLVLTFKDNTAYSMVRRIKVIASSTVIVDSAMESGTWAITGDSITLTGTSCLKRGLDDTAMVSTACGNPKKITKTIDAQGIWTVDVPEWKNLDDVIYPLTKNN